MRFISLDTVAEGGGQSGNLDDPQYRWLKRELRKARKRDQLVVVFGHHTLETMTNEHAGRDRRRVPAGRRARLRRRPAQLDAAPPRRAPAARRSRSLLAGNRNVIAYVAGHTHANAVEFVADGAAAGSGRSTPRRTSTGRSRAG